jgi:hypothetical protein
MTRCRCRCLHHWPDGHLPPLYGPAGLVAIVFYVSPVDVDVSNINRMATLLLFMDPLVSLPLYNLACFHPFGLCLPSIWMSPSSTRRPPSSSPWTRRSRCRQSIDLVVSLSQPQPKCCSHCEWMDGWMDGWMVGWMDGWMDGWIAASEE